MDVAKNRKRIIVKQASSMGFDSASCSTKQFSRKIQVFLRAIRDILERKRGAGYWLWKPYIIYHELYLASEGDIIIYSDAAVDFIANISHLIKLTEKQDIIVFKLTGWKVNNIQSS